MACRASYGRASDPVLSASAFELRRQLAQLAPPTDPYWSTQVAVPALPMPSVAVSRSTAPLGPYASPLAVRVDVPQLRSLAVALRQQAATATDIRGRAATAVELPFSRLDAFGLPGTRTGAFLAGITAGGSDHGLAAAGWSDAAARAMALADLVDLADDTGRVSEVLNDPRSGTALDVAVLLASASPVEQMSAVLTKMSDEDARWVLGNTPISAGSGKNYNGLDAPQSLLTAASAVASASGGVLGFNASAARHTSVLRQQQAAQLLRHAAATNPAHLPRGAGQWYQRYDNARALGSSADEALRSADDMARSSKTVPLKLGGGLAVLTIGYDIHSGKDPVQAVAAGGGGFAASVVAGAAIGSIVPVGGTVVGAVVGAGVGIVASGAIDSLFENGPDVSEAIDAGREAFTDTAGAVGGAIKGLFD